MSEDIRQHSGNKYLRSITSPVNKDEKDVFKSILVDVYAVLEAFKIDDPSGATQHALKKLLCAGLRGHKGPLKDLKEARDALTRRIQMLEHIETLKELCGFREGHDPKNIVIKSVGPTFVEGPPQYGPAADNKRTEELKQAFAVGGHVWETYFNDNDKGGGTRCKVCGKDKHEQENGKPTLCPAYFTKKDLYENAPNT